MISSSTAKFINFQINNNQNQPQSPWGNSGGNSGGNSSGQSGQRGTNNGDKKNSGPNNSGPNNKKGPNSDEIFKKIEDFFKRNFGNIFGNNSPKSPKSIAGLIILGILFLWLSSGLYKVNSDQNAVILYFGKFYSIATPGLNYHIPFPFGQVIKQSVTTVNTEEFGFSSNSRKDDKRNFEAESLMLTGDENIVDIEFQVQWQIADIKDFVFNIEQPNLAIRKTAESAMREVIARSPISDALSDGKKRIELETKDLLQQVLDYYGAGVRIVSVKMLRVDPPLQVIDAFKDVQTAKADKEKEINQAQSYANDIIPRARGEAAQTLEEAEAFRQEVIANSQGEAGRFMSVYNQYIKAKTVTKSRMYLETMESIYRDMDKVFIDKNSSKSGVVPYFPLSDLESKKAKPSEPTKQ